MATLFIQIDANLTDKTGQLTTQIDSFVQAANTVKDLIQKPRKSITDLSQALNAFPLPKLQMSGDLAATLNLVQRAIPTDLSSVTGNLLTTLSTIEKQVDEELIPDLNHALEVVLAIEQMTQIDLRCDQVVPTPLLFAGMAPQSAQPLTDMAAIAAQIKVAQAILDQAPSDATALLKQFRRGYPLPTTLPLLDTWIDPIETLLAWDAMQPSAIRDHMQSTLEQLCDFIRSTVERLISTLANDLAATTAYLHTNELGQTAIDLTHHLQQLKVAIETNNSSSITTTVAAIKASLDNYDNLLKTKLEPELLGPLPSLGDRLTHLQDDLPVQMSHLLLTLQPNLSLDLLETVTAPTADAESKMQAEVEQQLQPFLQSLQTLAETLNFQPIEAALKPIAQQIQGIVDTLDQELAKVVLQVRALFNQVESLLAAIKPEELTEPINAAIEKFRNQLTQKVEALAKPVRDALAQALPSITEGLKGLSFKDIIKALQAIVDEIAKTLKAPGVLNLVQDIHQTLDTASKQLGHISFQPITDQIVAEIDSVTAALQQIDPNQLSMPLKLALNAALLVLPESLTPYTDPMIVDFGDSVTASAVLSLDPLKQQPQKLLDKLHRYEPQALLGDAIAKPYQELLQLAKANQPSSLLAPAQQEVTKLKIRLQQNADPTLLLQPLETSFAEIMQAFDRLQPDSLVSPLEATIGSIIHKLPLDEVSQVLNKIGSVLTTLTDWTTFAQNWVSLLEKLYALLGDWGNSQAQFDTWIDSILDKVEAIADTSLFPFTAITQALDQTKAQPLADRFSTAATPLVNALNALQPQDKLTALVQAYASVPRQKLPESEKAAILEILDRCNPLDSHLSHPYVALATYQQQLLQTQDTLQTMLLIWDQNYHREDGTLASYRAAGATPQQLRQWVYDALNSQVIKPIKALFALLENIRCPIGAFLGAVQEPLQVVTNKLNDALGLTALTEIRDQLATLAQRLQDANLGFLRDGLKETFDQVRQKLDSVNPTHLKQTMQTTFSQMLDCLSFDLILPKNQIEQLDQAYTRSLIEDNLKKLDPQVLVIDVMQQKFQEIVLPLLQVFDLTIVISGVLDRLRSLEAELRAEMARINQAYQAMRDAVPTISLVDIDIDIDVDIDVGF